MSDTNRTGAEKLNSLSIRLPAKARAWLLIRAKRNGSSINAEIVNLLREAMKDDPARVILRTLITPHGNRFVAAWNDSMTDFADKPTLEEAHAEALEHLKTLGIGLRDVEFEYRTERLGFPPTPAEGAA